MAAISKFYFHDSATTNTGTMPSGAFINSGDTSGDATGARTARAANDTIGVSQTSAVVTSNADQLAQNWGFRRWVSAPLAGQTLANVDGSWTFSLASSENNLLHNQAVVLRIYIWRPGTGLRVGTDQVPWAPGDIPEPTVASTEQAQSIGARSWSGSTTILDGDILVFEASDQFTQGMATSYTSTLFYDGTTEASTTSCATFVTPPLPLTLFIPASSPPFIHQSVPFYPRASRPS